MGASLNSVAMSAMIKALRLRRTAEAISYAKYLWKYAGKDRLMNRLLMMSAEDGFNVSTMELISRANAARNRMSAHRYGLLIHKICENPNWWNDPSGYEYTQAWFLSEKRTKGKRKIKDAVTLIKHLDEAYETDNLELLLDTFWLGWNKHSNLTMVQWAYDKAKEEGNLLCMRTCEVFFDNANVLYWDSNISGQAVYRVLKECGSHQEKIGRSCVDINNFVASVPEFSGTITDIPDYYQDGFHTSTGSDLRFAGLPSMMWSCCVVYKKYGELNPEQKWAKDDYQK